jgi:uncharacterized protein (TIGR02284 family)
LQAYNSIFTTTIYQMNYPAKIKTVLKIGCIVAIIFNISAYMSPKPSQIEVLNQLVQVNIDRAAGYETASKEVEEEYLKSLFVQFANTSRSCQTELEREVLKLLGKPVEGTKTTFKIYQAWMYAKSMISNHNIETILHSCHHGEQITAKAYDNIIAPKQPILNQAQMDIIIAQAKFLKADHDRVMGLQHLISVNY